MLHVAFLLCSNVHSTVSKCYHFGFKLESTSQSNIFSRSSLSVTGHKRDKKIYKPKKKKSNMAFHWDTGFVALFKIISQSPQCAKLKGGSTKCRNHSCCLLCSIVTYNIKKREWWLKKQQQQKTQASVIDRTLPTSFKLNYTAC